MMPDITNTNTNASPRPSSPSSTPDQTPDHQFQPLKPLLNVFSYDLSPTTYSHTSFVTKVHFRLRHGGVPYANGFAARSQTPKGKVPYVRFTGSGEVMGDSGLVVQRLVGMGVLEDLSGRLEFEKGEVGRDVALRALVEGCGYWLTLYERWYDNYITMRDHGPFASLPYGVRHLVAGLSFQYATLMLYMQGTGRYTADEVVRLREELIGGLADFADAAREKRRRKEGDDGEVGIEDSRPLWTLGGENATEADFTMFRFLSGVLATETQPDTATWIRGCPSLVNYVERIHHRYFPDFDEPRWDD